jgi:simple sugar transport system ATP-binding protein
MNSGNIQHDPNASAQPVLICAQNIVKRFGSLMANDVDRFEVRTGEVHGLLGENGAGKSTLSKILYGYYRPDSGEIRVAGRLVRMASPSEARALGIGMVFQDFSLFAALSVYENIVLFMQHLPRLLKKDALERRIAETAETLGMALNLGVPVGALSAGEQQKVEILKQVLAGARLLILDEPTKVLAPQERAGLFATIAVLRARGFGIVLITHKLDEVREAADRISVMRKGRIVGVLDAAAANEAALLALMFERPPANESRRKASGTPGRVAMELRGVSTSGEDHAVALDDVTLNVREGEIVGLAGIAGSGQRELGALVIGRMRPRRGSKLLWGEDAGNWPIARIRQAGVAYVPENPLEVAGIGELSVAENFAIGARRYRRGVSIDWPRVHADAEASSARLGFPRPALYARLRTLSGGNVQRVVMARELATNPRLIVAIYPTRGLDVRSAQAVRDMLRACADQGAAVLLASEELDELFGLCDRLAVLRQGCIAVEFTPEAFASETVGAAMVGAGRHAHVH